MSSRYWCSVLRVPRDLEDVVAAHLFEAGTLGLEVRSTPDRSLRVVAYFDGESRHLDAALADRLGDLGIEVVEETAVPDEDWLARYREAAKTIAVGMSFLLEPREPEPGEPEEPVTRRSPGGRHRLRLPARRAFGTGSHATTQLMIEGLEGLDLRGARVLDVGTGTGVLAFAALLLGARRVLACDSDPAALLAARENSRLNALRPALVAASAAAFDPAARFDVLLVNVLPENVAPDVARLAALLEPAGLALVSGIVAGGASTALAAWHDQGLHAVRRETRADPSAGKEWQAYLLARDVLVSRTQGRTA